MDERVWKAVYETFSRAYKESFATIWSKAGDASIDMLLESIHDTELKEYRRMTHLMEHPKAQPAVVNEPRTVPAPDVILGSLVSRAPGQKLPDKDTCALISNVFADLAKAHEHYAAAAKGLADIVTLVSPEQLTLVLAAAVPPTLQLVLPPRQISPLSAPPPPPTTATTVTGKQDMIAYCKNKVLPDPAADCLKGCEKSTPTRVLMATVFYTLEKHLFDDSTPRAEISSSFCITTAQLHKAVTGIDYQSGSHTYKRKKKSTDDDSAKPTQWKPDADSTPEPSTSGNKPGQATSAKVATSKSKPAQTFETPSEDTLSSSSSSSEELPDVHL